MYGTKEASLYDGDVIIERDEATYIGRLKPGYPRGAGDSPVEQMNVWQIEQISTEEIVLPVEDEETEENTQEESEPQNNDDTPGEEDPAEDPAEDPDEEPQSVMYITRRKYPEGNEDYKFKISDYLSYTYDFRH